MVEFNLSLWNIDGLCSQTMVLGSVLIPCSGFTTDPGLGSPRITTIQYWFWFLSLVYRGSPDSLDLLMIVGCVDDDHLQVLCCVTVRNVLALFGGAVLYRVVTPPHLHFL